MTVLLVQPPFDPTDRMPPLGIACLAAALRVHDYDVKVLDLNLRWTKSIDEMVADVRGTDCDVVGLTCWGNTAPFCIEFSRKLKDEDPSIVTILGGEIATFLADDLLKLGSIDFVVKGEGEETLVELLDCIDTGGVSNVAGIVYQDGDRTVTTVERGPMNLDALPFPAWDLFESLDVYQKFEPDRVLPLQASRGCVFNCIFCSVIKTWYGTQRRKSPSRLIEEIEYLINTFGVNCLSFHDDAFALNEGWVKTVCEELIAHNIEVKWGFNTRPDLMSEELLALLRTAGCSKIFYGIESFSPGVLKFMRKDITPDVMRRCVEKTVEANITPDVSVIYGFPIETEQEVETLIDGCVNLQRMGAENINQHVLSPYPGTDITARYETEAIPDPFLKLLRPNLINVDLLRKYPDYVPDLWIFKHYNMTTQRFLQLYLEAFVRVSAKEVFI